MKISIVNGKEETVELAAWIEQVDAAIKVQAETIELLTRRISKLEENTGDIP